MYIIAGLGNPGAEYLETRHNVGFMTVDAIAARYLLTMSKKPAFKAEIAIGHIAERKVILCKPQTYMNLSGDALKLISHFYKVTSEQVVVVHDEIDIPVGMIKYKIGGGNAGHNGLKSITHCLGTTNFRRVRIGVGRPANGQMDIADYVLTEIPHGDERALIDRAIQEVIDNIQSLIST